MIKKLTTIIGGTFGEDYRKSSVISKLSDNFKGEVINGGLLSDLPKELNSSLIIWMPNISNETPKMYPKKSTGNVLIVSKVMRPGYNDIDAISRIFDMHANAVIAIEKEFGIFSFKLIDALGVIWYEGSDIKQLAEKIKEFYFFTASSIRYRSERIDQKTDDLKKFIQINKSLASFVQKSCGERYFGNLSTRCSKLFPSTSIFVSPRNSDKDFLTAEDMIFCYLEGETVMYVGDKKPSIDSPTQLKIYENCPQIKYMIHGHAFIKHANTTDDYYLCGDVREASEVSKIIGNEKTGFINLKNHGFLIFSESLEQLQRSIKNLKFTYKR